MTALELGDIQGFVVSSYARLTCAAYVLLRITSPPAARDWLARTADAVTTARGAQEPSINIALSFSGLRKLELDPATLDTFPLAFQDGMASEGRARILGDTGESAPEHWLWGASTREVHVLEMIFASDEGKLTTWLGERAAVRENYDGFEEIDTLRAGRQPNTREHFGFVDSIARPTVEGLPGESQALLQSSSKPLKPGEFVLGYPDDYGKPAVGATIDPSWDPGPNPLLPNAPSGQPGPPRRDLGKNGTYLVFRQLEQHVATFWQFLEQATAPNPGQRDVAACERLAAKLVGRWLSGAPLVKAWERDPGPGDPLSTDNDFGYIQQDPYGFRCPIGAHIRRSNPRDSLESGPARSLRSTRRHSIIRRGRLYGEQIKDRFQDDGAKRGLYFICLNGDLERQFEFIQQTWLNNPVFGRLYNEQDPIVGNLGGGQGLMTIPANPVRTRVPGLRNFITVRGGAYFFMPGINALRVLAHSRR
jgi:deferrochelatase/peroxidase EfeB